MLQLYTERYLNLYSIQDTVILGVVVIFYVGNIHSKLWKLYNI